MPKLFTAALLLLAATFVVGALGLPGPWLASALQTLLETGWIPLDPDSSALMTAALQH